MTDDHDRLIKLETQMERIVSDIESEKATRARINSDFKSDLNEIRDAQKKSDKMLWMGLGGLGVLQFVVPLLIK